VLYAAETLEGAFIETFGRNPGVNVVRETQLAARSLALIEAARPLKLVDLTGPGLAQNGMTRPASASRSSAGRPGSFGQSRGVGSSSRPTG
jgi:hypothetical protein